MAYTSSINKVKSYKEFYPTMYQGLVFFPFEVDICAILQHITKFDKLVLYHDNTNNFIQSIEIMTSNIKIHPPGSLGVNLDLSVESTVLRQYNIGTIDFKAKHNHNTRDNTDKYVSILLFKDKMKISGGFSSSIDLQKIKTDRMINKYLLETGTMVLLLIMNQCGIYINNLTVNISLINGYMRLGYHIPQFIDFCKNSLLVNNKDLFDRVVMPLDNERGRIGAVRLYPFKELKSSAHFDHMGAVQFFAFKSIEDMTLFSSILRQLIDQILGL